MFRQQLREGEEERQLVKDKAGFNQMRAMTMHPCRQCCHSCRPRSIPQTSSRIDPCVNEALLDRATSWQR